MANGQTFTPLVDLSLAGYDRRSIFISRRPWTCNGCIAVKKGEKIPLESCAIQFCAYRREIVWILGSESSIMICKFKVPPLSGLSVHYV